MSTLSAVEMMHQPVSWCKVEVLALRGDTISLVKDLPPPPLTVMSISLKTVQNPKTHHNEVRVPAKIPSTGIRIAFFVFNSVPLGTVVC